MTAILETNPATAAVKPSDLTTSDLQLLAPPIDGEAAGKNFLSMQQLTPDDIWL